MYYATGLFRICIFLPRFLDAQLWRQTGHILASGALFLCIQNMSTKITFGAKWASKWIIVRYSDVPHNKQLFFIMIIQLKVHNYVLISSTDQLFEYSNLCRYHRNTIMVWPRGLMSTCWWRHLTEFTVAVMRVTYILWSISRINDYFMIRWQVHTHLHV